MSGFLGSGRIYVDRSVAGVYQGLKYIGNATKFEIKENSDKKERWSKDRSNYGSALNTVFVKKPAEINITLDDLDKDNLGLVFLGTTSDVTEAGSTASAEDAVAYKGMIIQTAHRHISALVVTGIESPTPTTYTVTTDYVLTDHELGLITIPATSTIPNGTALHLAYTYAGYTSNKVAGGTNSNIIMKVLFDGVNQADLSKAVVNVHQAVLSPTSGVDFLSDDFTKLELAGVANVPPLGTEAYTVELNVVYT